MTRDHYDLYYRIEHLRFNSFQFTRVWTLLFRIKSFYFCLAWCCTFMSCRGKANYSGAIFKKFCLKPQLSSRSAGNVISFEGLRLSLCQKLRNSDGDFIVFYSCGWAYRHYDAVISWSDNVHLYSRHPLAKYKESSTVILVLQSRPRNLISVGGRWGNDRDFWSKLQAGPGHWWWDISQWCCHLPPISARPC